MHGESVDGDYIDWKGKVIGNDGNDDNKIHLVKNKKDIKQIKNNNKQGGSTSTDEVDIALTTTTTVLEEAMHVLNRTKGHAEETSVVTGDGQVVRGKKGKGFDGKYSSARLPNLPGEDNTSIHSHPTAVIGGIGFNALQPGDLDPEAFKHFGSNVIVGAFGPPQTQHGVRIERTQGAAFFGSNITTASKPKAILSRSAITRALWTINNR